MASIQDLPDEVILKVIKYLDINKLVKFGEVSKRMRAISSDQSLWQKINLGQNRPGDHWYPRSNSIIDVPTNFVKMAIENGCQYLSLVYMKLGTPGEPISMTSEGDLSLDQASCLKYLDLTFCEAHSLIFEEILASCHSLQKLSLASTLDIQLITSKMIDSICYQNGRTLQTLNLSACKGLDLESIQKITKNCAGLKNVELFNAELSKDSINFLVNNLTPQVEKLSIGSLRNLKDEHVKTLVARCNKLSVLNLKNTTITNDSLTYIIRSLQHTLEKLNINLCEGITYAKVTELRSMPKLRVLNFGRRWDIGGRVELSDGEKENLKKLMPLVRFGAPICADERKLLPADGIWDVEGKQFEYFKKRAECQFEELLDQLLDQKNFPMTKENFLILARSPRAWPWAI